MIQKIKDWLQNRPQFEFIYDKYQKGRIGSMRRVRRLKDGKIFEVSDDVICILGSGIIGRFCSDLIYVSITISTKDNVRGYMTCKFKINDILAYRNT